MDIRKIKINDTQVATVANGKRSGIRLTITDKADKANYTFSLDNNTAWLLASELIRTADISGPQDEPAAAPADAPAKRGPGRPKKVAAPVDAPAAVPAKRGPGRPRKVVAEIEA